MTPETEFTSNETETVVSSQVVENIETSPVQTKDGPYVKEIAETLESENVTISPRPTEAEMVELAKAALDASGFLQAASESEFIQDRLAQGGLVIDKVSLNKFLEFRAEVIRAFKHLGLDTRRHFSGE